MTSSRAARQHLGNNRNLIRRLNAVIMGALVAATLISTNASAQTGKEEATSGAKGTVGLALLGAEAVITVEAAIGLDKYWMYAVGGGVGAIGGGVGGYFIDKSGNAQVSMGLLVGGLVFAVPTTIAMLGATAYKPPQNPEYDQDAAAEDQIHLARFTPVPSVVDVRDAGKVSLRMPAVEVAPVFSRKAQQMYALPQATEVKVPLLHLSF